MSSSGLVFFSLILTWLLTLTIAQNQLEPLYQSCSDTRGNYTVNSTYSTNLKQLVSNLSSLKENNYGFYNISAGQNNDVVHAIALCRGDVRPDACLSCIQNAANLLTRQCPNQKEAFVFYDNCMFRYSNRSMLGVKESGALLFMWNRENVTEQDGFNQVLRNLLDTLRGRAASGGSLRKFATANASAPGFKIIFALVQCSPDLSQDDCNGCLIENIARIPQCCDGKAGGRVIAPSCNFRYEIFPFYDPAVGLESATPPTPTLSPTISPPQQPSNAGGKENNTSRIVATIAVPIVVFVMLGVGIYLFLRIKKRMPKEKVETVDEIGSVESLQYDLSSIIAATNNFSDANKLGQGGFGAVYKGKLSNGKEIAVKRLSKDSGQGDLEFKNEVMLVARLQHRNLVRLLGFCLEGNERILIYEFVLNTSLDHFIFDPIKRTQLGWESRYKIIGGVARGILYLHEDSRIRIIHRDLKASNILLDAEMSPKIADFGMARLFVMDQSHGDTSRIVGTYGYMAPEYILCGHFSVKSDVFSFGVLVLELVSGRRNSCFHNGENVGDLLSYAWKCWRDGIPMNLVDSSLLSASGSVSEMMRCIHIGLLCVQENEASRPNMASVVLMLSSHSLSLPAPSQPAFFMHSTIDSDMEYNSNITQSNGLTSENSRVSKNEVSITEPYPR